MNYELAKELKEAGFKTKMEAHWAIKRDGTRASVYEVKETPDIEVMEEITLSELIEAIDLPKRHGYISCSFGEWSAYNKNKDENGIEIIGKGSTPEEAVARLWLALRKSS